MTRVIPAAGANADNSAHSEHRYRTDERDISEHVDTLAPWRATDECLRLIASLRHAREQRTGRRVPVNWFWRADPQIEKTFGRADFAVVRFLRQIEHQGHSDDVHGNHPHGWRWSDSS